MTTKTLTAENAGPVIADITCPVGRINVTVDPALKCAEVEITGTGDASSKAARDSHVTERFSAGVRYLLVDVPKPQGTVGVQTNVFASSGNVVSFSSNGVVMNGNSVTIGGVEVVRDGVVVAQQGMRVDGVDGGITVDVKIPEGSSVRINTLSGNCVVHGHAYRVDAHSASGSIEVESAQIVDLAAASGAVRVGRLDSKGDLGTVSGSITVGRYLGTRLNVESVSGEISVSATPEASGQMNVSTVSGAIATSGARHLHPQVSTVTGTKSVF